MRKVFLSLLICALSASSALATMSDVDFLTLSALGSLQQINEAIRDGANVNAVLLHSGEGAITPLMAAAEFNTNPEVITALIDAGADVNARCGRGDTALIRAAHPDPNPEVTMALIEAGADVNVRCGRGWTMLMLWAVNPEVATVLLEAGADVNARYKCGSTLLMLMATYARDDVHVEIITFLLSVGADPKLRDNDGRMAIDRARENEALRDTDAFRKFYDLSF